MIYNFIEIQKSNFSFNDISQRRSNAQIQDTYYFINILISIYLIVTYSSLNCELQCQLHVLL